MAASLLTSTAARARGRLASMDVAAAMRAVDPQAEALARLASLAVPVSPETVRTALAVLIALLVELGSGLGPWLVTNPGAPRRTPAEPEEEAPATLLEAESSRRRRCRRQRPTSLRRARIWRGRARRSRAAGVSGAVRRRRGAFLAAGELRAAYFAAADAAGVERLTPTAFGRLMTEMGHSREKVGGDQRYVGITLASRPAALPPPASSALVEMTPAGRA